MLNGPGAHERQLKEARDLDAELFRLARSGGRLRLRIGQALSRIGDDFHELGFSTLGGYAFERCSRTGRWAADSRVLAKRLEGLPCLRAALERGVVGWSMAELLARYATPETEERLLADARKNTVRAMRSALREQAADSKGAREDQEQADDEAEQERRRTLTLSMPIEEAWMLEAARMLIEHMDGTHGGDWFEALLAEGYVSLMDAIPAGEEVLPEDVIRQHAAWVRRVDEAARLRAQAELRAEERLHANQQLEGEAPDEEDLPSDLKSLDVRVRQWAAALASRDLWFGKLVARFLACQGWQQLGYASETQYARERLGMSRASMRSKLALGRNTLGLEAVVNAVQNGQIGYEAAALITRVASVDTEAAWIERARVRTFKHLREEVRATELFSRLASEPCAGLLPPTDDELAFWQAAERDILCGEAFRSAPTHSDDLESDTQGTADARTDYANAVQMSGTSDAYHGAYATVRIRVREEVALHFRQLEEAFRRRAPTESFTRFLCTTLFGAWQHTLGHSDKWEAIYRRDLYRCTNPVCNRRSVTPHHVLYRSQGGGHGPGNVTSPCEWCHLEGEHGGRLKIRGRAPRLTWTLGREPILKIEGRERTLLD